MPPDEDVGSDREADDDVIRDDDLECDDRLIVRTGDDDDDTSSDCFYDSPPLKPAIFLNERFMAARHKDGYN